jgi:hypothetical protein
MDEGTSREACRVQARPESLKDERQGKFQLSWYLNRSKMWQDLTNTHDDLQLPRLSHALKQADDKSSLLNNRQRNVADPTATTSSRKKLADEIPSHLEAKTGCKKTARRIGSQ